MKGIANRARRIMESLMFVSLIATVFACSSPDKDLAHSVVDLKKLSKPVIIEMDDDYYPAGKLDAKVLTRNDGFEELDSIFSPGQTARGHRLKADAKRLTDLGNNYRRFVTNDKGNPFLQAQNRHRYARMMLIDNALINSGNYEKIEFYTRELIECKLGNYRHILSALAELNGHIDDSKIIGMKSEVEKEIYLSIRVQEMIVEKLPGFIAEVKRRPQTSGLQIMIHNLENYETEARRNDIDKLRGYLDRLHAI